MYAQKDYPQNIGNSERTIEKDGSLIVAFANLLARFGFDITPERLNNVFTNKEVYSTNGELTWTSLAVYFNVGIDVVTEYNEHSIVRIEKDGTSVFALIDNPSANTVIDSVDGTSKVISDLGEAKEFYAYKVYEPIPYPAVQEAVDTTIVDGESYIVSVAVNGYGFSSDARDHGNITGIVEPGVYHVFNRVGDMINVTKTEGQVGLWINPADNVTKNDNSDIQKTISETTVIPEVDDKSDNTTVKVKVIPADPNKWQTTYSPNAHAPMIEYTTDANITVKDIAGLNEDKLLPQGTLVPVAGFFTKDGKTYARTVKSVGDKTWYGVPKDVISLSDNEDDDINTAVDTIISQDVKNKTALKVAAKTAGKVSLFNPFSYVKKKEK